MSAIFSKDTVNNTNLTKDGVRYLSLILGHFNWIELKQGEWRIIANYIEASLSKNSY